MENKDIAALLKRRRWAINPTLYRQKQRDYRARVKANLPHCDECENCVLVEQARKDGYQKYQRLCIDKMRLIEQKVSNCLQWCQKRSDREMKMQLDRNKIDVCLARKKMSIKDLAEVYGVSRTRMNVILNQRDMTPIAAGRMADALGVDVTQLI